MSFMNDDNWKEEYKQMKVLQPFQIKLLDEGAQSLSQSWLLNEMWCHWKDIDFIEVEKDSLMPISHTKWTKDPCD